MDLTEFAEEIGDAGPVTIAGLATRGGPVDGVRTVMAPVGPPAAPAPAPLRRTRAARVAAARRRSLGVVAKTSRTVSLNWRMLENPAAKAT